MRINFFELLIKLLFLVGFMPLISGSIRYDLLIYPIFLTILLKDKLRINKFFKNLYNSSFYILIAFMVGIFSTIITYYTNGLTPYIPFFDNILQFPVALLVGIYLITNINHKKYNKLIFNLINILIIGFTFSSILAIASFFLGYPLISNLFINESGPDQSVALLAAQHLRYFGIYNQAIEAAQSCILAIICCHFAIVIIDKNKVKVKNLFTHKLWFQIAAYINLIGGLFSLSKLFMLFGLPFFALLFWLPKIKKFKISLFNLLNLFVFFIGLRGIIFFLSKLNLENISFNSFYNVIFATRYADNASSTFYKYLLNNVPFIGTGFTKNSSVPVFDSGGLEFLTYFGILGTIFIVIAFFELLKFANKLRKINIKLGSENNQFVDYAFYINSTILISIISLLGGPSITLNRLSIIYPCLIILFSMPLKMKALESLNKKIENNLQK